METIGRSELKSSVPAEGRLLSILKQQQQVDENMVSRIKNLTEISNRLDNICNRIDRGNYPKNAPTTGDPNQTERAHGAAMVKDPMPDGLVGEMIATN